MAEGEVGNGGITVILTSVQHAMVNKQSSKRRACVATRLCTLKSIPLTRLLSPSSDCSPASSNTAGTSPSMRSRSASDGGASDEDRSNQ